MNVLQHLYDTEPLSTAVHVDTLLGSAINCKLFHNWEATLLHDFKTKLSHHSFK